MKNIIEFFTIMGADFIAEMIALAALPCILFCMIALLLFIAMKNNTEKKNDTH